MSAAGPVLENIYNYGFQLVDLGVGRTVLTITPNPTDPTQVILRSLYEIAEDVSMKQGVELLRRIVE